MKMRSTLYGIAGAVLLLAPMVTFAQSSDASQPDVNSAIESLRADIRADKVATIRRVMQFTPQESDAFWPIYNKYAAEMTKVNDDRVSLVKDYNDKFTSLSDADAKQMVARMLDFEQRRIEVKKKYLKEFNKSTLSGTTIAKFFQLEHRFDLLVDVELASHLPSVLDK